MPLTAKDSSPDNLCPSQMCLVYQLLSPNINYSFLHSCNWSSAAFYNRYSDKSTLTNKLEPVKLSSDHSLKYRHKNILENYPKKPGQISCSRRLIVVCSSLCVIALACVSLLSPARFLSLGSKKQLLPHLGNL